MHKPPVVPGLSPEPVIGPAEGRTRCEPRNDSHVFEGSTRTANTSAEASAIPTASQITGP
jgi:hypothetical protein